MRLKILEEVGWGREKQASVCRQKCFLSRVDDCFGFEGFFFEIVASWQLKVHAVMSSMMMLAETSSTVCKIWAGKPP